MEGEEGAIQGVKSEVEMNLCDPQQQQGVCLCGHTRNERPSALQSCQLIHTGNPKLYKCSLNIVTVRAECRSPQCFSASLIASP